MDVPDEYKANHPAEAPLPMLHEAQFHIAEGKFDALVKRLLGLLAKH